MSPRCLGLALLLLLPSVPAAAQNEPPPWLKRNAEAVVEGRAGLDAYQRGEWDLAHRHFERAEFLTHSPVFMLHMARAKRNSGAWLDAQRIYERVSIEPLPASTPEAWRLAVDAARAERTELAERLPSIIVVFGAGSPTDGTLTLDTAPFERLGEEVFVDPGAHLLVVRRSDGAESRRPFTLVPGQKRTLVKLEAPARAIQPNERPAARKAARRDRTAPMARGPAQTPPPTLAYVTGGAGLGSLLVGVVAGTLAWNELRQIKADCDGTRCNPRDARRLDSVRRLGTIADVSVAVGAAGLGTSAILLWVVPASGGTKSPVNGLMFGTRYRY